MNYKILFTPRVPNVDAYEENFETLKEANAALNTIADYTLMLHDKKLMPDYSNMGSVLEKDEDGNWSDVNWD